MRAVLAAIGRGLQSFWIPPACAACGAGIEDHHGICPACASSLEACGRIVRNLDLPAGVCAALAYEGAARDLIHRMKYAGDPCAVLFLADAMGHRMREVGRSFDGSCVVPVPLHPIRRRERGFNQTERLARRLGKRWGAEIACDILVRVRYGQSQTILDPEGRRRSVDGAFRLRRPPPNSPLVLLDDVWTTGATAGACMEALRDEGFSREVVVLVAAASPRLPRLPIEPPRLPC